MGLGPAAKTKVAVLKTNSAARRRAKSFFIQKILSKNIFAYDFA
jgi:hypothetical protein